MGWFGTIKRRVFGGTPTYDGAGLGRRTLAWTVANPGAVAALAYTQEQLRELRARPFSAADQERVGAAWIKVFADIDALGPNADPGSEAALEIGRRARALINEFTQGDPANR